MGENEIKTIVICSPNSVLSLQVTLKFCNSEIMVLIKVRQLLNATAVKLLEDKVNLMHFYPFVF